MKHHKLHEIAKFASGVVAADFLTNCWALTQDILPVNFLGVIVTSEMLWPTLIFNIALFLILVHYGWNIGKIPNIRERAYLIVAGAIFVVIAAAHIAHIIFGIDVTIADLTIPLWLSWVGVIVTVYLAYMSFKLAVRTRQISK